MQPSKGAKATLELYEWYVLKRWGHLSFIRPLGQQFCKGKNFKLERKVVGGKSISRFQTTQKTPKYVYACVCVCVFFFNKEGRGFFWLQKQPGLIGMLCVFLFCTAPFSLALSSKIRQNSKTLAPFEKRKIESPR